jgi:hypothetical protein
MNLSGSALVWKTNSMCNVDFDGDDYELKHLRNCKNLPHVRTTLKSRQIRIIRKQNKKKIANGKQP